MSARKTKGSVGVIGLGIMGGAFAKNLAAAGWRVVGYDVDPARCRAAAKHGVLIADSPAALAAQVPVIITSLPKPEALDATVKAIVAARLPRKVVVEASTFTLADKERAERTLRKAGHTMLDAPVSGTGAQAQSKDLVFYASGDSKTIARLKPMFAAFARNVFDLGAFGNGSKMKYVANHLVAINNVAAAEAMVLGMKAGLPPQMIYEMIKSGAGNSRVVSAPTGSRGAFSRRATDTDPTDTATPSAASTPPRRKSRRLTSDSEAGVVVGVVIVILLD